MRVVFAKPAIPRARLCAGARGTAAKRTAPLRLRDAHRPATVTSARERRVPMTFMDKVKSMLGQHEEKVSRGVDKAAKMADSKTKGKYSEQIKSGTDKAKNAAKQYGRDQNRGGEGGGKGPGEV
jgi:hypothetical protein